VRNARLWHALLGVEKTVVEDVEFDELASCWSCRYGRPGERPTVAVSAGAGTTPVRADAAGGRWI